MLFSGEQEAQPSQYGPEVQVVGAVDHQVPRLGSEFNSVSAGGQDREGPGEKSAIYRASIIGELAAISMLYGKG